MDGYLDAEKGSTAVSTACCSCLCLRSFCVTAGCAALYCRRCEAVRRYNNNTSKEGIIRKVGRYMRTYLNVSACYQKNESLPAVLPAFLRYRCGEGTSPVEKTRSDTMLLAFH